MSTAPIASGPAAIFSMYTAAPGKKIVPRSARPRLGNADELEREVAVGRIAAPPNRRLGRAPSHGGDPNERGSLARQHGVRRQPGEDDVDDDQPRADDAADGDSAAEPPHRRARGDRREAADDDDDERDDVTAGRDGDEREQERRRERES